MNLPEVMRMITERLQATASVKNVYGEPVTDGERTVVPVARVRYAFSMGGGGVSAAPAGALEITASGTRFIGFQDWRAIGLAFAAGALAGAALAALSCTKRIEIVKPDRPKRQE